MTPPTDQIAGTTGSGPREAPNRDNRDGHEEQQVGKAAATTRPAAVPPQRSHRGMYLIIVAALLLAITVSVSWGQVDVSPSNVWRIVTWHITGWGDVTWQPVEDDVVWQLRMPRTLLGALVGAGLATVGVVLQALVRNPLAEPWLLGVQQGGAVGAVAAIVLGAGAVGALSVTGAAFVGSLGAMTVVYVLARRSGSMAPLRLVLTGVVIGYGLHSVAHYLVLLANNPGETNTALFWLLGHLGGATWDALIIPAIGLAVISVFLLSQARVLNALLVGDETAAGLGIHVERWRRALLLAASMLTGVMVSASGVIGFVGLVVPHAMRMLVGGDHRRLLPASLLGGAAFLVVADTVARMALSPRELPIGVVTAVVGAPTFLALMHRRRIGSEAS